jgi:hypothetical protein
MAFAAADVPNRIDLLLNGEGYMFSEPETNRAQYGFTPTYVTRGNTQGDYGDNFQDFWLTATQRDWSLGDGQVFFRPNDEESSKRFYIGSGLDINTPGKVNLGTRLQTNAALAANALCGWRSGSGSTGVYQINFSTSTTVYGVDETGVTSSLGAHGWGVAPNCGTGDPGNDYVSATNAGTVGVRRYNGAAWSTFSATGSDYLCYHNNSLYGWSGITGGAGQAVLQRYDSAGVATALYTFVTASAGGVILNGALQSYGGKLAVLVAGGGFQNGPELWSYDGVGLTKLAELGQGVRVDNSGGFRTPMTVVNGILCVGVWLSAGTGAGYPAVWYYANGSTGILWKSPVKTGQTAVPVAAFNSGLLFTVQESGETYFYNPSTGGANKVYSNSVSPWGNILVASPGYAALFTSGNARVDTMYGYTGSAGTQYAASGTLTTSQYDFDSSLTKIFRGIKVEFDTASGGTVDISYQIDGVGGTYTSLQTGAASGTEYTIASTTGKTISVKVTLNGSGANSGPTLKRISVRAAPFQTSFLKNTYVLQLGGVDGKNGQQLRDGTFHPNDGLAQATALRTVATTGTAVTVVDSFGSFTGVVENEGFQIREYAPQEYVAVVPIRQI